MNLHKIILDAKLGSARKDAQIDTCAVFAAALYDTLTTRGIVCRMVCAMKARPDAWTHSIVEVADRYYDSMGEFSADIYRARARIHPKVELDIQYQPNSRYDCYQPEFDEMHAFYVKMLNKVLRNQTAVAIAA